MINDVLVAFSFLTILPMPDVEMPPQRLARAVGAFPLVGVGVGMLLVVAALGITRLFPPGVGAAILLATWVLVTGALHLDGFLDACDGLFGGRTPKARLEIMRDERIGAFALSGGVLLLLAKYAALVSVLSSTSISPSSSPVFFSGSIAVLAPPLIVVPLLARFAMVFAMIRFPYARETGLGAVMKAGAGPRELAVASATALIISVGLLGETGLAFWVGTLAITWVMAHWVQRRIPGLTGDIYGAICELVEMVLLLVWTAMM